MIRIIDCFPEWFSGALFKRLGEKYPQDFPWAVTDGVALDMEYFGNRSGEKGVSPLVEKIIAAKTTPNPQILTQTEIDALCAVLKSKFLVSWSRWNDLLSADYNPLENYSMKEKRTPNTEEKTKRKFKVNAAAYGFNSSSPVPASESSGKETDNVDTKTLTGTDELERSGNIGVTTSQQMAQSEIDLWRWKFYNSVFDDVDTILTIPVYEMCVKSHDGQHTAVVKWGAIIGDIDDQTDLQSALAAKSTVTGTNDGTQWLTITIDGITKSIPVFAGVAWGDITGSLANQTDLYNYLENIVTVIDTKADAIDVDAIDSLIPVQASPTNQLADKNFVNSTVGTNTSNYISNNGQPFASVAALEAYTGTVTNNDYAIVTGTDAAGNTYFDRYKATVSGSTITWAKEYRLNNSTFTAAQWAAISSGITSGDVALISTALQLADIVSMAETWTFTLTGGGTVTKQVVIVS